MRLLSSLGLSLVSSSLGGDLSSLQHLKALQESLGGGGGAYQEPSALSQPKELWRGEAEGGDTGSSLDALKKLQRSEIARTVCGDGLCQTPEHSVSCPVDCGELTRNPRLLGSEGSLPYFWGTSNFEGSLQYMNVSTEVSPTGLVLLLENSADLSQAVGLMAGQKYVLTVERSPSSCLEVFVFDQSQNIYAYLPAEAGRDGVSSLPFDYPASSLGLTVGVRALCRAALGYVSVKPVPISKDIGWSYPMIHDSILESWPRRGLSPGECRKACADEPACCAWQVCPGGEAEGCGGCYLISRKPEESAAEVKGEGWEAGIERAMPEDEQGKMIEECKSWLVTMSAHEEDFYDESQPGGGKVLKYHDCGLLLRTEQTIPKQVFVGGAHIPTLVVANHRQPTPTVPTESQQEKPLPHFFALPFYDTNIGNVMKQTGCMNVMQSYEMQSILRPGGVFVDVGANLGSYTVPMAEAVGPTGMVLAFEPFRWTYQFLTANVALNGLMNVWTYQVALSDEPSGSTSYLLQPNLRFFSSPGGVRAKGQTLNMDEQTAKQLYDQEWGEEVVSTYRLDDLVFPANSDGSSFLGRARMPQVDLIKIDVEGMELNVMRGAQEVLRRLRPVVWSENVDYFEKNDSSFLEFMEQMDYFCGKTAVAPQDLICQHKETTPIQQQFS